MTITDLCKDPKFKKAYNGFYKFAKELHAGKQLLGINEAEIPGAEDILFVLQEIISKKVYLKNDAFLKCISSYTKSFNSEISKCAINCLLNCGEAKGQELLLEEYTNPSLIKEKNTIEQALAMASSTVENNPVGKQAIC